MQGAGGAIFILLPIMIISSIVWTFITAIYEDWHDDYPTEEEIDANYREMAEEINK